MTVAVPEIHEILRARFGESGVLRLVAESPEPFVVIEPRAIAEVLAFCRDDPRLAFDFPSCLTGFDSGEGTLSVDYHLFSHRHRHDLSLRVIVTREDPRVPTAAFVYPAFNWHEREAYDLTGIVFDGHPDLRRLLLPEDWVGWPLRKDFQEQADYRGIATTRDTPLARGAGIPRYLEYSDPDWEPPA
ncbi:MAG: NADH-quinone oxidoreductase subunit C [Myxococcales bacterium]|nr:NADH-quinone oxidoreductase subunit C [Myxococcales bacterium]